MCKCVEYDFTNIHCGRKALLRTLVQWNVDETRTALLEQACFCGPQRAVRRESAHTCASWCRSPAGACHCSSDARRTRWRPWSWLRTCLRRTRRSPSLRRAHKAGVWRKSETCAQSPAGMVTDSNKRVSPNSRHTNANTGLHAVTFTYWICIVSRQLFTARHTATQHTNYLSIHKLLGWDQQLKSCLMTSNNLDRSFQRFVFKGSMLLIIDLITEGEEGTALLKTAVIEVSWSGTVILLCNKRTNEGLIKKAYIIFSSQLSVLDGFKNTQVPSASPQTLIIRSTSQHRGPPLQDKTALLTPVFQAYKQKYSHLVSSRVKWHKS